MHKPVWLICLFLMTPPAMARAFDFPASAVEDPAALSRSMPGLAREVIAVYREDDRREIDRRTYLDDLFRLQMVAGQYADAGKTLTSLRALGAGGVSSQAGATQVLYEVFAQAKVRQDEDGSPFDEAVRRSFREALGRLDDRMSALVLRALGVDLPSIQQTLKEALEKQKGKGTLPLEDALALIRAYQAEQVFPILVPLAAPLIDEDDRRRYVIDQDIPVRTADGATVCVLVVRPRSASARLPALLNFTIYANPKNLLDEARRTASNGYAGVEGLTRGKGCSPDKPVPYEHDGSDAAAVIDWISRQAWSDGRVGMYGGSYEGFTQWAAAKRMPKALKALMPSVTAAPGIDVPMEGNVFQSFVYYWPFYTTTNKTLDDAPYNDRARWWRMNREWYVKGLAYRTLDKIDGTPNPFFNRWLDHPSYDSYWQGMIPYKKEFARIDIPVLTTTGYYDDAQIGALYYFIQHHEYSSGAEHYLVIGPYDHIRGQRGTFSRLGNPLTVLRGYETDPVAQIDIGELRYQWFDFVFKDAPKPSILKDKVNYQVMGANEWKHAPSLAAMGKETLRFHLSAARTGDDYRLSERKPTGDDFVPQKVDLADRTDIDREFPGGGIVDKDLNRWGGVVFVSDPFLKPTELSGLFSGRLDFATNKKDLDFAVELYDLTARGEYVELSFYMARASHVRDRGHRQLLTPGGRQHLDFKSGRLTSRRFQPGSRLVAVLRVIKAPGAQINYGTGKDVSDETITDGKEPLSIQWFGGSFIDVPVRR
ncbi:MAG TPA: CocE/NonD family hydrolase [Thermoanaerobaculia bacterium]|nr:CocE/NonD family hydrolase [Thermoanaerobaculia bacterium]